MFHVCLYYAVFSVPCCLLITCWERADLLALLSVMFFCVFVTFPYGVSGQVWYLIVLICIDPDLCGLPYFTVSGGCRGGSIKSKSHKLRLFWSISLTDIRSCVWVKENSH